MADDETAKFSRNLLGRIIVSRHGNLTPRTRLLGNVFVGPPHHLHCLGVGFKGPEFLAELLLRSSSTGCGSDGPSYREEQRPAHDMGADSGGRAAKECAQK
eukprot:TRINITY_DN63109_c0_g1_i1.p1 TRINITY_DN63109_c0_g1~~TRINITY_DN63109_c0_g1_i1.p1  ORF type:complete len:101 (+),score=16.05 TRINITY_DN63109_c0_g1_i1:232-534(+)